MPLVAARCALPAAHPLCYQHKQTHRLSASWQARFCSGSLRGGVDKRQLFACPACRQPITQLCRDYKGPSPEFTDVAPREPVSPSVAPDGDEEAAVQLQRQFIEQQQQRAIDRRKQLEADERARQEWERERQSGLAAQAAAASGARAARGGEGGSSTAEERRKRSEPLQEAEDLATPGPPSKKPRAAGTASEAEAEAPGAGGDLRAGADDTEVVPAATLQEAEVDAQPTDASETQAAEEADEAEDEAADGDEATEVAADDPGQTDAIEDMDTSAEEAPAGDGDASGGSPEDVNDEEQTLEQPETAAAGTDAGSESGETTAAAPAVHLSLDDVLECVRKGDIERFAVELPTASGETNLIRLNAIQAYREAGGDPDELPNIDSPAGKKEPLPDGWVVLKAPETVVDRDAARGVKLLYILTAAVAAANVPGSVEVVPFLSKRGNVAHCLFSPFGLGLLVDTEVRCLEDLKRPTRGPCWHARISPLSLRTRAAHA